MYRGLILITVVALMTGAQAIASDNNVTPPKCEPVRHYQNSTESLRDEGQNIISYVSRLMGRIHEFNNYYFVECSSGYYITTSIVADKGEIEVFSQYKNHINVLRDLHDFNDLSTIASVFNAEMTTIRNEFDGAKSGISLTANDAHSLIITEHAVGRLSRLHETSKDYIKVPDCICEMFYPGLDRQWAAKEYTLGDEELSIADYEEYMAQNNE